MKHNNRYSASTLICWSCHLNLLTILTFLQPTSALYFMTLICTPSPTYSNWHLQTKAKAITSVPQKTSVLCFFIHFSYPAEDQVVCLIFIILMSAAAWEREKACCSSPVQSFSEKLHFVVLCFE